MPRTTLPRCFVDSPSSSAGPISQYRNNAASCALARRSSRSCSAEDNWHLPGNGDCSQPIKWCLPASYVTGELVLIAPGGQDGASSLHRDSRAASSPGDKAATSGHRPGIC